ncbi:MAG: DNA methylase [Methanobrevibacter sp. CfCl-M3]
MNTQTTLYNFNSIENVEMKINNHEAKAYSKFYRMHKYWSKKPYNIIKHFIEKYSEEEDIILDPFNGSGVSISESIFNNRKGFGIDINPSAIFITDQQLNKIDTHKFEKEFKNIEKELKEKINSFYSLEIDNQKETATHFIWKGDRISEIWYKRGNKKLITLPNAYDYNLYKSFSYDNIPFFYPKEKFFTNSRINAKNENHVYELFTPRNLMELSLLMNRIEKIEDENIKNLFKLCFTGATGQASKMVFVINRKDKHGNIKKEVGSWVIGYWIPKENMEINVWNCFNNRYNTILKAKKEYKKTNIKIIKAQKFEDLLKSSNLLLINEASQIALKKVPSESIDYIITDPPHGDRQPYLELSLMWNSWLKKESNIEYENEIIVSNAKKRNKNIANYHELLNKVLNEIERVLKYGKYFSLMFNSIDDKTWINLITSINTLNFKIEKIETLNYSANSVVQDNRKGGLKTDFILTFKKYKKEFKEIKFISMEKNRPQFINIINTYLKNNEDGLETYELLNFLIHEFLNNHEFFKLSEILKLLNDNFKTENGKWSL